MLFDYGDCTGYSTWSRVDSVNLWVETLSVTTATIVYEPVGSLRSKATVMLAAARRSFPATGAAVHTGPLLPGICFPSGATIANSATTSQFPAGLGEQPVNTNMAETEEPRRTRPVDRN